MRTGGMEQLRLFLIQELQRQGQSFLRGFRTHRFLYGLSILFVLFAYSISAYVGLPIDPFKGSMFLWIVLASLALATVAVVAWKFARLVLIERPDNPSLVLGRWLLDQAIHEDRISNIVHVTIVLWPLLACFVYVKSAIPLVQPFAWDKAFMQLDRVLHFGWHPWQLLQPLLGLPIITVVVNFFYNLWFFVMFFCLFLQGFAATNARPRQQFLLAFVLAWMIGGSVLAIGFSSAGPCYYSSIGLSPDPYQPLMDYLNRANQEFPIWALTAQQILWDAYSGDDTPYSGISAMPSLHVTIAVLQAFMGWHVHRWLGLLPPTPGHGNSFCWLLCWRG